MTILDVSFIYKGDLSASTSWNPVHHKESLVLLGSSRRDKISYPIADNFPINIGTASTTLGGDRKGISTGQIIFAASSTLDRICYSVDDGVIFSQVTVSLGLNRTIQCVGYAKNDNGDEFFFVGNTIGGLYRSTNSILGTWVGVSAGANGGIRSIASTGLGHGLLIGSTGRLSFTHLYDGVPTAINVVPPGFDGSTYINAIAYSPDHKRFVYGGAGGLVGYCDYDPAVDTAILIGDLRAGNTGMSAAINDIRYSEGLFFAVGATGQAMFSYDGIDWHPVSLNIGTATLLSVSLDNGHISIGRSTNINGFTFGRHIATAIQGVITDSQGNPCQRTVRFYRRSTGGLLHQMQSDPLTGAYEITLSTGNEIQRIALADDAAEGVIFNDIIDRVLPG